MHEEHLLRDLVAKVNDLVRASPDATVVRARIWIGAFSHLREAVLRDRWPEVAAGTPAAGVGLVIDTSSDAADPRALDVILVSVDLREPMPAAADAGRPTTPSESAHGSAPCA